MSEREKLGYSPYCAGNSEYPPDEPNVGPVDSDEVYCWMNRDLLGDERCDALGELFASAPELKAEVERLRAVLETVTVDRDYWKGVAEWAESDSYVLRPRPERYK